MNGAAAAIRGSTVVVTMTCFTQSIPVPFAAPDEENAPYHAARLPESRKSTVRAVIHGGQRNSTASSSRPAARKAAAPIEYPVSSAGKR